MPSMNKKLSICFSSRWESVIQLSYFHDTVVEEHACCGALWLSQDSVGWQRWAELEAPTRSCVRAHTCCVNQRRFLLKPLVGGRGTYRLAVLSKVSVSLTHLLRLPVSPGGEGKWHREFKRHLKLEPCFEPLSSLAVLRVALKTPVWFHLQDVEIICFTSS